MHWHVSQLQLTQNYRGNLFFDNVDRDKTRIKGTWHQWEGAIAMGAFSRLPPQKKEAECAFQILKGNPVKIVGQKRDFVLFSFMQ
jgi:hypothetical protein